MTDQITLKEALKLVSFRQVSPQGWRVGDVNGNVDGHINGYVRGSVKGCVGGNVDGSILGHVDGDVDGIVKGKISGSEWEFIETPEDKLRRLITKSGNQELIDTFNQMENN